MNKRWISVKRGLGRGATGDGLDLCLESAQLDDESAHELVSAVPGMLVLKRADVPQHHAVRRRAARRAQPGQRPPLRRAHARGRSDHGSRRAAPSTARLGGHGRRWPFRSRPSAPGTDLKSNVWDVRNSQGVKIWSFAHTGTPYAIRGRCGARGSPPQYPPDLRIWSFTVPPVRAVLPVRRQGAGVVDASRE